MQQDIYQNLKIEQWFYTSKSMTWNDQKKTAWPEAWHLWLIGTTSEVDCTRRRYLDFSVCFSSPKVSSIIDLMQFSNSSFGSRIALIPDKHWTFINTFLCHRDQVNDMQVVCFSILTAVWSNHDIPSEVGKGILIHIIIYDVYFHFKEVWLGLLSFLITSQIKDPIIMWIICAEVTRSTGVMPRTKHVKKYVKK